MTGTAIDLAIDELYGTGWSALNSTGCQHAADGRAYPSLDRIRSEFEQLGFTMQIRDVQLFDCFRVEWTDGNGNPAGAVVGGTEIETAIYALARCRRSLNVGATP